MIRPASQAPIERSRPAYFKGLALVLALTAWAPILLVALIVARVIEVLP